MSAADAALPSAGMLGAIGAAHLSSAPKAGAASMASATVERQIRLIMLMLLRSWAVRPGYKA
jgi:hypothetical protein